MPDVDRTHAGHTDDRLGAFQLDANNDSWLDQIRKAEQSDELGTIGPYELLEEVGRGGQGVVYRAVQPGTDRVIAVKRMLAGSFASDSARRRFEREVEAAASVNHPGLVTVYGIEQIDGQPLLAMEWIDGVPITNWVRSAPNARSPKEIVTCMSIVCDAVAHAHRHGIIHRDLKPSNILVDAQGQPHVLDFGLAKLIHADAPGATITRPEQFIGTPAYAAPEQIRANEKTSDVRTDVYALGIVLYEMLTGTLPYSTTGNLPDAFHAIEHTEPKRPSHVSSTLDRDLELIVLKSLRKSKRDRYQSVDALRDDLQRYLEGEPVVAHPPTTLYQIRKLVRRHRMPFVFAITTTALIFGFAVVVSVQASRIAAERDTAVLARSEETKARQAAEHDRARAEHESARAQAISDFLKAMLSSVKPEEDGHDVRVADVLAEASQAIADDFDGPSETAAILHETVSDSYRTLGIFEDAERELLAALSILQDAAPADEIEQLRLQHHLASLYLLQNKLDEAEALLLDVISKSKSQFGDNHEQVGIALQTLSSLHQHRSDYDAAIAAIEESIKILSLPDMPERHLLSCMNSWANLLMDTGQHEKAHTTLQDVMARQIALFGEDHPHVMSTKGNLAHVIAKGLGRPDEGVPIYREVVAYARRTQGPEHPETAMMISSLAGCLQASGALEEAEPLYREAIDIYRLVYDEPHPDLAIGLNNLGHYLRTVGRLEEAEPVFVEAVDLIRKSLGDDHVYTSILQHNYGEFLFKQNRLDEAESHIRDALDTREKRLPPEHMYLGDSLSVLGKIHLAREEYEQAEPTLRRCAEIRSVALPAGHWRIPDSHSYHGESLMRLGRYEEAEVLLLKAYEDLSSAAKANESSRNGALERIISLYELWGKDEEAEQWRARRTPPEEEPD